MAHVPHVLFGIVAAALAGALMARDRRLPKATVGAHEVITTIMLNWIAYWAGSYLFGRGGPLQNHVDKSIPISDDIADERAPAGDLGQPGAAGAAHRHLHRVGALFVFYLILNRTTLGYEVRAVGFNPEAARYGGISVARNFILAMAISGLFAGLARRASTSSAGSSGSACSTSRSSNIGFIGIAVALLGRNTAVGVGLGALLFGALVTGTSTRSLDPRSSRRSSPGTSR